MPAWAPPIVSNSPSPCIARQANQTYRAREFGEVSCSALCAEQPGSDDGVVDECSVETG